MISRHKNKSLYSFQKGPFWKNGAILTVFTGFYWVFLSFSENTLDILDIFIIFSTFKVFTNKYLGFDFKAQAVLKWKLANSSFPCTYLENKA